MHRSKSTRFAALAALTLGAAACGEDPASPSADRDTVADFVASASVDDAQGALRTNAIPRPTSGGPVISVDGHSTIVNGGTAMLRVASPTPFETVFVAGSTPISRLFVPVPGFFEVELPEPATTADLLITFPQVLPSGEFDLYIAAVDAQGRVGTTHEKRFDVLLVGTGDVQVTVTWDSDSDVDLHVVDPTGWEVYWANRQVPSGGELDLDSNAACSIDGVRNENITWAAGTAPQGGYVVRLDYWSSCSVFETNYTVLVNNGGEISIHHGTFTGPGDQGGFGSGVEIAAFTRTTGPPPVAAPSRPAPHRTVKS